MTMHLARVKLADDSLRGIVCGLSSARQSGRSHAQHTMDVNKVTCVKCLRKIRAHAQNPAH